LDEKEGGPRIKSGVTARRKAPRWVIAFLRALARTGEVRAAAVDAGIDHSTAYARRRAHAEFASLWRGALAAHAQWGKRDENEAIAAVRRSARPLSPLAFGESPSPSEGGGAEGCELVGAGAQIKRAGEGRWSQAKEAVFFDELAATANVKRSAEAAGVSTNAVYARRMKDRLFKAKWAAVLESGRAAIEMKLVEAANKSFDPDEIDTGDVEPRVSVAEAIRIVQLHGSKAQRSAIEEIEPPAAEIEEIRERLFNKLERLRKREMAKALERGWTLDESHDCIVPPGWIRGPDYQPKTPEEPVDFDALYR
jgi:hypothetical protein